MRVSNTLSGRKEEFLPQGDEVKIYVCGVTPYDDAHIGHAMSYIIFDVIRRYLKYRGYRVKYVQNVTDIDDKIINRANERGIPPNELAQKYTDSFHEDMEALNIMPPDVEPKATGMIDSKNKEEITIIKVIQGLIDKGYAYAAGGSVYFRVRNVDGYGKLAHRSLEQMMAGARIEAGEEKEHPMDFVLWKAAKQGEPSWDSPWGKGRPGWHIECSAMSLKYLGETVDIHGGGQDLIFPHHENEIAQSESFTGVKPFVRYWLHNGLLQLGEEKMSKSLGNLITIKEALAKYKYSADAVRIFVLNSHYRSPLTYSEAALEAAERGADRLRYTANSELDDTRLRYSHVFNTDDYRRRFIESMDDDFNTAQALAILFDLTRDINKASESGYSVALAQEVLKELEEVMGLTLQPTEAKITVELATMLVSTSASNINLAQDALSSGIIISQNVIDDLIRTKDYLAAQIQTMPVEALISTDAVFSNIGSNISLRKQFRQAKQWQLADEIRDKLGELGIALEDTAADTDWKYKRKPKES